jgi:outer membrane protein OmpA-like peptidoglycan-associated protein
MLKYTFLLSIGLFGTAISAWTQMSSNDVLYENFEFRKFINAQSNSEESQKVNLQLAHSYYFLNDFENANSYFAKLDWNDENLELENHLFYANSLKNEAKIEAAKKEVQTYLSYYPKDKDALVLQEQIANYSKINELTKSQIILHNLEKVNSASAQFSPIFKDEKFYFVGENKNSTYSKSEIEYSDKGEDLVYGKVARPETGIYLNDEQTVGATLFKSFDKFDVGAICWSKSDNLWLLTLTPRAIGWVKMHQYAPRIYKWKEGEDAPKKLKIKGVKGGIGIGHPAISADGKFLVFSLDKGVNGSDLYVSSKISDLKWSKPTKLSAQVNTLKDEVFPILEGDSVLYFSSDGKLGFGGLDVYKIAFNEGKIEGESQLLTRPFNTESDDYSVSFKDDLKTQGFVVSDRENGIGDADIYFFNTKVPWKLDLQIKNDKGELVTNKEIKLKVNGKDFELKKLKSGNYETIELEVNSIVSLNLSHSDSLISKEFKIPNTNGKDTSLVVMIWDKKEIIASVSNQQSNEILENQNLELSLTKFNSIFFDFNKFSISKNYQQELKELIKYLKENPTKILIVKTLADERGDVIYNLDLATKRAKEIYTFLGKKGISPQQIKLQSLGEAVYDEKCNPNCDESIHSKYRRADFEIR